jgi:hypothetical protein
MPTSSFAKITLALLLVAVGALRLWGIDFLLPQWREPDAQLVQHLRFARHEQADEESGYANAYPYVLPYVLRALPERAEAPGGPETLQEHLEACAQVYVETRTVIALVSLLAVPLTFFLARRFVSERWALFAAALYGASFLCQWFAQEARPHAAASATFLAAVVAALRLRSRPTWGNYVLAGVAAAIAVGSLHSGVAVLLAGLVAHFAREGRRAASDLAKLLAPVLLVALGIAVFYPFIMPWTEVAESTAVGESELGLQFGRHAISLDQFTFYGAYILGRTLISYEPVLVAGLGVALLASFAARARAGEHGSRGDLAVVLAYVVPYALILAAFDETFERFVTPLVPFLAVAVAWGLARLASNAVPLVQRLAFAFAASFLVVEAAGTVRLAWLRSRPDTMELAAEFVQRELSHERDPLFFSGLIELPIARSEDSLFAGERKRVSFSRWAKYQAHRRDDPLPTPRWTVRPIGASKALGFQTADSIAEDPDGFLRKLGTGVFVYGVEAASGHPADGLIYQRLRERGTLLFRCSPHASGAWSQCGLGFQDPLGDFPPMFPRVLTASALGPVIEIYRVERW